MSEPTKEDLIAQAEALEADAEAHLRRGRAEAGERCQVAADALREQARTAPSGLDEVPDGDAETMERYPNKLAVLEDRADLHDELLTSVAMQVGVLTRGLELVATSAGLDVDTLMGQARSGDITPLPVASVGTSGAGDGVFAPPPPVEPPAVLDGPPEKGSIEELDAAIAAEEAAAVPEPGVIGTPEEPAAFVEIPTGGLSGDALEATLDVDDPFPETDPPVDGDYV